MFEIVNLKGVCIKGYVILISCIVFACESLNNVHEFMSYECTQDCVSLVYHFKQKSDVCFFHIQLKIGK